MENSAEFFKVMYTIHKTQKRKTWNDGYLRVDYNSEAKPKWMKLYDFEDFSGEKCSPIDSERPDKFSTFSSGDSLNFTKYLVEIEEKLDLGQVSELNSNENQNSNQNLTSKPGKTTLNSAPTKRNCSFHRSNKKSGESGEEDTPNFTKLHPKTFSILYSAQKFQKRKVWNDGKLIINEGHCQIFNENDELVESFRKNTSSISIQEGTVFDSPKHVIEVNESSSYTSEHDFDSKNVQKSLEIPKKKRFPGLLKKTPNADPTDHTHAAVYRKSAIGSTSHNLSHDHNCKVNGGKLSTYLFMSVFEAANKFPETQSSLNVIIPSVFSNIESYVKSYEEAILAEVSYLLLDISFQFANVFFQLFGVKGKFQNYGCIVCTSHGVCMKRKCFKKGPNYLRNYYSCSNSSCSFFKWESECRSSLRFSENFMIEYNSYLPKQGALRDSIRSRGIHFYDEVEFVVSSDLSTSKRRFFLKIHGGLEKSENYSYDDLWVISSKITFEIPSTSSDGGDIFFIGRSIYHGPSKSESMLELEEMEFLNSDSVKFDRTWKGHVYAIRCGNTSTELTCIQQLKSFNLKDDSLLTSIILAPNFQNQVSRVLNFSVGEELLDRLISEVSRKTGFNENQMGVIRECSSWFLQPFQEVPKICLIHGVFGSGKSSVLAGLIMFLDKLFTAASKNDLQILVCASTNVAVDRVLLKLKDSGFEDFIRIGSVKRINKQILPYTIFQSEKEKPNECISSTLRELKSMLSECNLDEKKGIDEMIADIESDRYVKRIENLNSKRVVGVTVAASTFSILDNKIFPIVLLDESSQMIEPQSIIPIGRFDADALFAFGDPNQLGPTLRNNFLVNQAENLSRAMFVRLKNAGVKHLNLNVQYRCNPKISEVANKLFYGDSLIDGIHEVDRRPICDDLEALEFIDVPGAEKSSLSGSYINKMEANTVVKLVRKLARFGKSAEHIGIISLYKSQAELIDELLRKYVKQTSDDSKSCFTVSTVDAFQGSEKEIIILSSVRTSHVGFTDSPLRLNVAITRARNHLIILGSKKALCKSHLWSEILKACKISSLSMHPFLRNAAFEYSNGTEGTSDLSENQLLGEPDYEEDLSNDPQFDLDEGNNITFVMEDETDQVEHEVEVNSKSRGSTPLKKELDGKSLQRHSPKADEGMAKSTLQTWETLDEDFDLF